MLKELGALTLASLALASCSRDKGTTIQPEPTIHQNELGVILPPAITQPYPEITDAAPKGHRNFEVGMNRIRTVNYAEGVNLETLEHVYQSMEQSKLTFTLSNGDRDFPYEVLKNLRDTYVFIIPENFSKNQSSSDTFTMVANNINITIITVPKDAHRAIDPNIIANERFFMEACQALNDVKPLHNDDPHERLELQEADCTFRRRIATLRAYDVPYSSYAESPQAPLPAAINGKRLYASTLTEEEYNSVPRLPLIIPSPVPIN